MINIQSNIEDWFYKKNLGFAIRDKLDILSIVFSCIEYIISHYDTSNINKNKGGNFLCIKEFSDFTRIFIKENSKIYSICMPFKVRKDENQDNKFEVIYQNINLSININSQILSLLKSLFKKEDPIFLKREVLSIGDEIVTALTEFSIENYNVCDIYELINYLLIFEYGYIRYDHDVKNENYKIHPLYHFDLSYCNYATYKFGLNKDISLDKFIDIFDSETDQLYIHL